MEKLKFRCTLKSDIILNVKSASEGPNASLDFIPGSCFLGVVAKELYDSSNEKSFVLFHSGKVRFGDAHPAMDKFRTLRVPSLWYAPKGEKLSEGNVVVWPEYSRKDDNEGPDGNPRQFKQCRTGFYAFTDLTNTATPYNATKTVAIKSAYDSEKRCSEDNKMYLYESLATDQVYYFTVEIDDESMVSVIKDALSGMRHIGRSRTAQYGLVEIEEHPDFIEYSAKTADNGNEARIYADGRLIFLDKNGMPTVTPTEDEMGLPAGSRIDWSKSQTRTFQYSPWNSKRQAFDTDRYGIEKGSVIVVKFPDGIAISDGYIGSYNNEGFGKILVNPAFLDSEAGTNGKCIYHVNDVDGPKPQIQSAIENINDSALLAFVNKRYIQNNLEDKVYKSVQEFKRKNSVRFSYKNAPGASQWGAIRQLASSGTESSIISRVEDFISHGESKKDWQNEYELGSILMDFLREMNEAGILRAAAINLASEMGKLVNLKKRR